MVRLSQDPRDHSIDMIPKIDQVVCSEMVGCSNRSCVILDTAPSHGLAGH